jgi:hypothetical protein
VDLGYSTAGLRAGGDRALRAAEAARLAHQRLAVAVVRTGIFGRAGVVDGVDDLVGHLAAGRDTWQRTGQHAETAHTGIDVRARATARTGDELVTRTADLAERDGPVDGPIARGMLG